PEKEFPIEKHMCIDKNLLKTKKLPRYHTAEISRFLVGKYFLGQEPLHISHKNKSAEYKFIKQRKFFPHPILGLAFGIGRMSFIHNITHLLCVMDPALNKLLGYYGLNFVPVGPLANYHGLRRPYYFDTKLVSKKRHKNFQNIWKLITDRNET
ncbi:MAG: PEP-CTERM/exosortase system-associated acyltransferase, partial [Nitrosomonas sp.]|nr:PEP-CTERM/exosortase system-associated acyltransferase [Nitrosomonas sp.]